MTYAVPKPLAFDAWTQVAAAGFGTATVQFQVGAAEVVTHPTAPVQADGTTPLLNVGIVCQPYNQRSFTASDGTDKLWARALTGAGVVARVITKTSST